MNPRETQEHFEEILLSPSAAKSVDSKGRERPIPDCPMRTCYQRDRDRILHCKSFRRLKFKTQVFISPEGDHYRTRLTHTLEVTQVARTIARCLRLNEDLTEAIGLGHDLGHTPFGHTGERSLNKLMEGGFRHNEQSLRIVERLENDGEGLNLTWEVRDGILNHSGEKLPMTLEGQCVARADRIAYINHDIDDAIRAGVLKPFELPENCVRILGRTHGERINTMIADIVEQSAGRDRIMMSETVQEATDELRAFLFKNVYMDSWRDDEERKCGHLINSLFAYFCEHPERMPNEHIQTAYKEGTERGVADYIACMTDRYALRTYREAFMPDSFPVF